MIPTITPDTGRLPAIFQWSARGRLLIFALSAASIWCLLAEFYGLCSMRTFTFAVLIPATVAMIVIALLDRARGDGRLWQAVAIGAIGGFLAACAYDAFRMPFVLAAIDKTGPEWLRLPLFKIFPRFGAMILNHPYTATQTDSQFTLADHVVGWIYHFSNGITFGVMYMAMIGDATRRSWWWAVALATFLELAMLFTPYTGFFGIHLTARFVVVTLTAHLLFGAHARPVREAQATPLARAGSAAGVTRRRGEILQRGVGSTTLPPRASPHPFVHPQRHRRARLRDRGRRLAARAEQDRYRRFGANGREGVD